MAQRQPPMQATDTFVATMEDGSDHLVTKGQVLPWGHPLVKRDRDGAGTLFRPLDLGEDDPDDEPAPPKSAPAKAEAPAAVKPAAVKPAAPPPEKPAAGKAPSRG